VLLFAGLLRPHQVSKIMLVLICLSKIGARSGWTGATELTRFSSKPDFEDYIDDLYTLVKMCIIESSGSHASQHFSGRHRESKQKAAAGSKPLTLHKLVRSPYSFYIGFEIDLLGSCWPSSTASQKNEVFRVTFFRIVEIWTSPEGMKEDGFDIRLQDATSTFPLPQMSP
jgi:hypothetical protein